jgi:hypothetical protein
MTTREKYSPQLVPSLELRAPPTSPRFNPAQSLEAVHLRLATVLNRLPPGDRHRLLPLIFALERFEAEFRVSLGEEIRPAGG